MKTVNLNRIDQEMLNDLRQEVELLKQLDHPNVIKLFKTAGAAARLNGSRRRPGASVVPARHCRDAPV